MRYLQMSISTLVGANYSRPAQANTFFPRGNHTDHIHLGVTTQYTDDHGTVRFAEQGDPTNNLTGNVFVIYISLKKNDRFWFRLDHNTQNGYFSFPHDHNKFDLTSEWQGALSVLNIVRELGA